MSFKHHKMLNSPSKCLKITLKVIKLSKPETRIPKKIKLMGDIPPCQIHCRGKAPPPPHPPLYETLLMAASAILGCLHIISHIFSHYASR
jgi:hypothetical protein